VQNVPHSVLSVSSATLYAIIISADTIDFLHRLLLLKVAFLRPFFPPSSHAKREIFLKLLLALKFTQFSVSTFGQATNRI